jgi:gamma-glutamyltranspeptidase/glutathione hydrolase
MKKLSSYYVITFGCKAQNGVVRPTGILANEAMVVSAREEASKIGCEIMKKGGNAFDAMVATELALAVAYLTPETLVVVDLWFIETNGKGTLDYREKAPLAATKICF